METANVLSKLALARQVIKAKKIRPDAKNEFSNYDYFSPEQIARLVTEACIETNSICIFNLKKDELGHYGELCFTDMDSNESITTIMRTEKPSIKATNETQQMGGMQTYTKRYCLMSLFDIEDNTADFDSQDNTKAQNKAPKENNQTNGATNGSSVANEDKPWLNKGTKEYNALIKRLQNKTGTIEQALQYFKISKAMRAELEAAAKNENLNPANQRAEVPTF